MKIGNYKSGGGSLTAFLFLFSFLLLGCEKDIEIELNSEEPKLVVEATIENGQPPMVVLTRSLDYYAAISPQQLVNSFVRGAEVFVSDGTRTHKLKEYSTSVGGFTLVHYSIDSSNLSTAVIGELNKQYSLRIVANGQEYNATTTIPGLTKRIDSVWWKAAPPQADLDQVIVMVKATDPAGFGDYIRYYTKRNSEPFLTPFNATFDDLFIDGTTYELPIERGIDRNREIEDRDRLFLKGDTVTLKLSNIDKATYDFWRTMEFAYASVGNPFATPIKVQSNISGNALGYFGGYASQYRTLIIPQ
ncbi:DUF4249 domain-containing protein [Flavisolibacter sp. BT320]|nr:DUF4249 domain-containing protein [Flavisolibacter longurius]